MIKKLSLIALTLVLTTSCVSKKIYTDLESKYANLKKENRKLADDNQIYQDLKKAQNDLTKLQKLMIMPLHNVINYKAITMRQNQILIILKHLMML